MREGNKHTISEELLFRHFARETSQDENEFIYSWVDESEENSVEYERVKIFYLDLNALGGLKNLSKSEHHYDKVEAWRKLNSQNQFNKNSVVIQKNVPNRFLKIAIMVLVLVSVGWFTYDSIFTVKNIAIYSENTTKEQQLVDGSTILLNSKSLLKYPEKFVGIERKVVLQGEAYFNISPNPDKPFIIETPEVQIKVLGTSFNVNAFEESDSIVVSVDTGIVLMSTELKQETLEAGTTGIYYRSTQSLVKIESNTIGTQNFWYTKSLYFNGTSLNEVIKAIKTTYQTDIKLSDPMIGKCKITVTFENESLEDILDIISTTLQLKLTKQDNSYLLSGKACYK